MKSQRPSITPTPKLVILLLMLGVVLLVLPHLLARPLQPAMPSAYEVSPRPSPTWRSLPTRSVATAIPQPPLDLLPLNQALLRGDLQAAEELWRSLDPSEQANGGIDHRHGGADQWGQSELLQAGTRLALMLGQAEVAEDRAWDAVITMPTDAQAWSLLGYVLQRNQKYRLADEILANAEALDPTLTPILFRDRWQRALQAEAGNRTANATRLTQLATDYQMRYPDSIWLPYYQAEALIASGASRDAIELLIPILTERPTSPALLWYTLGRAYLDRGAYDEAATALEAAASRTYQGDTSLTMITLDPVRTLNIALGQSYLGSDRCPEAESIFRRIAMDPEDEAMDDQPQTESVPQIVNDGPDLTKMIEAAVICQTPTPTLTPWIPAQIGTVTPRP